VAVAPPNAGKIAALLAELKPSALSVDPFALPSEPPSRALARALTGGVLDAEGAARLLEVGYVEAVAADEGTPAEATAAPPKQLDATRFVDDAHATAVAVPPPAVPPPATDLTFYAAIRDRHHETIVDFDELDVPTNEADATRLLEAAWVVAGRAGAASIGELLAHRAAQEAVAATNAREHARQFRLSRSPSDVSGTPDVMLEPESHQVELDLEAERLAGRSRQYDGAVTTMARARAALEHRAAQVLDDFAEDAALVTREYLEASRQELEAQAERYGLEPRTVYTYEDTQIARLAPAARNDAVATLTKLVVKVVETRDSINSMKRDAESLAIVQPLLSAVIPFRGELAAVSGDPRYGPQAPISFLYAQVANDETQLRKEVAAAIAGYLALRSAATTAHPVLRFVAETAKVEDGKVGEQHLAVEVARAFKRVYEADQKLEERIRGYPMGALDYPVIVAETLRRRAVQPASFEDGVVRDAVAERRERKESAEVALDRTWTAAGLVIGAVGFFASGGLGVFAVTALYDMLDALKEFAAYERERTLYASTLEETLAFAQEDPSATSVATAVAFGIIGNVL
jgi:hypothetical protein